MAGDVESVENLRKEILTCFRRAVRVAHVAREDPRQQVVLMIRLEGMRAMALAAGLTNEDLDIASIEAAAASLGQKI